MKPQQGSDARLQPVDRVHTLQWALGVGAVVLAVPVVLLGLSSSFVVLYVLTGACVVIPLFLRNRWNFVVSSVTVGMALTAWGCSGSS